MNQFHRMDVSKNRSNCKTGTTSRRAKCTIFIFTFKKNGINNNSMDMDCYEMSNVLKQVSKTCHFMSWLNSLSMACYGMSVIATPY